MRKKVSFISCLAVMLTMFSALVLGACGDKKKNITLTITPATWNNEGYTITNADYKFEDVEDGGKKVVFDYKKKAIDITLYVKPNDGYIIDNAIMRAVTTNYLNNDTNYSSFAIEKGEEGKITIKSVDQDIVLIIERVRRANMFIYFDAMGGEFVGDNPLYVFGDMGSESSANPPTKPTKANCQFAGWYTMKEVDGTMVYDTLYDFDHITLVPDVILYAKWIEKSTLTFDSKGGSAVPSQELYDQVALRPSNPTREHHEFAGWYTTETYDEGTEFDFEQPVTSDTTIYAKWIEGKDFTFYLNDGSMTEEQTPTVYHTATVYNSVVEQPQNPTREGYRFDGWYTDTTCSEGNQFDFNTIITANTSLYAKWVQQVTVSFVTQNEKDNITDQVIDINSCASEVVVRGIEVKGMTLAFAGWALTQDVVEGESLIDLQQYTFDKDTTLYARYEEIRGYNIYFHDLTYIKTIAIQPYWNEEIGDYINIAFINEGSFAYAYIPIMCTDNLNIDVKVKENYETDSLVMNITNYENNGSLGSLSGAKDVSNTSVFHFIIEKVSEVMHITFAADVMEKHTITFYKNIGEILPDGEVETPYETKIAYHDNVLPELPVAPERGEEFKFGGWYKDKACTQPFDEKTETITADFNLYAKWIEGKKVTFYLNDGSEQQQEWRSVYTYDEALTEPADVPTREGYRFNYWTTDVQGNGKYTFVNKVENNMSLYAQWIECIVISFKTSKEGEVISSQTIDEGTGITAPVAENYLSSDATDENLYVFVGWARPESETVLDLSTEKFDTDTTLHAVYTAKKLIKFAINEMDTTNIESVEYHDSLADIQGFATKMNVGNDYYTTGRDSQSFTLRVQLTNLGVQNIKNMTLVVQDYTSGEEIARISGNKPEGEVAVFAFNVTLPNDAKLSFEFKRGI